MDPYDGEAGEGVGASSYSHLSGDYYRETNDVTRGVSFPMGDAPPAPGTLGGGSSYGDFYSEDHDVCRGVTFPMMTAPEVGGFGFQSKGFDADLYRDPLEPIKFAGDPPSVPGFDKLGYPASYSVDIQMPPVKDSNPTERFNETHIPLDAPTDPLWKFEVTTLFIDLMLRADQIGNLLLDFLESDNVAASITKAKREKYSLKYDGFVNNLMCTTKCRMYKQSTQYALEFQRRSGDTVVFNSLFRQTAEYLQKLGVNIVEGMPQVSLCGFKYLPPPPPLPMCDGECDDLGPIIDMSYVPELQAESASFLASNIDEPSRAGTLCKSSQTLEAIENLMKCNKTNVAFPTSKVLLELAKCKEATDFFARNLPVLESKVRSDDLDKLPRANVVQAIKLALEQQPEGVRRQYQSSFPGVSSKA